MPVTKVVVADARMVDASPTITVVGTVEPRRRSRVCAEIAGLVAEMPAREGHFVAADGVICRLNDDTLKLRLAEERAKLDELHARHEELLAGTRKEELVRLKALSDEANAIFERWKFEMQRIEKLYAGRDSNDKEYQDTRAEFLAAERRMIAAQAAYNLGLEGPRKEVIAQAAHTVAEQQAVVDRIAVDLGKTVIRPPFAGHVVMRNAEVGEWIPIGGQVVEMAELVSVLVRVDVPESVLPHLSVGDPVRVRVDALDRSFEGGVYLIIRQADRNARTFPIAIQVDNRDGLLAAGMFARATMPTGPTRQTVAVPKDGIVEREGVTYMAMVIPGPQGGLAGILAPVTLGADVNDYIAITSGNVRPGTQVITRGTERMLPFPMPIEIVDEFGTPVAMPDRGETPRSKDGA